MLRTFAVLGVLLGCTSIGILKSSSLRRRHDTIRAMLASIMGLSMCMQYSARPIGELALTCQSPETKVFWEALVAELKKQSVLPAWRAAMLHARKQDAGFASLQPEELNMLEEYARGLGGSDRRTQAKNAAILEKRFEAVVSASLDAYSRKGRMYRSMGVLSGIAVAILLW